MKKLILLVAVVVSIALASCGSKQADSQKEEAAEVVIETVETKAVTADSTQVTTDSTGVKVDSTATKQQ